MNIRFSRLAMGVLVVAAIVSMSARSWAIRYGLPASKDEWDLKYDVAVYEAEGGKLTVVFTLADEGRLKPIDSIDLVAFSRQTDRQGGRAYDVLEPIELKKTKDGKQVGQAQMPKQHLDRAKIRIITHSVDGKRQPSGGAYYNIPLKKYLNTAPVATSPSAKSPR